MGRWRHNDRTFLVLFSPEDLRSSAQRPQPDAEEWIAFDEAPRRRSEVARRARDPRFVFNVKKRHGNRCLACGFAAGRLVEAAHIITVAEGGSNHPANGIPLCPTHHRAFDAGLFAISPRSLEFVALGETTLAELQVSKTAIAGLPAQPHPEALAWRWSHVHDRIRALPARTESDLRHS